MVNISHGVANDRQAKSRGEHYCLLRFLYSDYRDAFLN